MTTNWVMDDEIGGRCPQCGAEYRPGVTTCRDCGVALLGPDEPMPEDDDDVVELPPFEHEDWVRRLEVLAVAATATAIAVLVLGLVDAWVARAPLADYPHQLFTRYRLQIATHSATTGTALLVLIGALALAGRRWLTSDDDEAGRLVGVADALLPIAGSLVAALAVAGFVLVGFTNGGGPASFRVELAQNYLPAIALAALAVWLAPPPRFRRVSGAGSPPDEGTAGPAPLG